MDRPEGQGLQGVPGLADQEEQGGRGISGFPGHTEETDAIVADYSVTGTAPLPKSWWC